MNDFEEIVPQGQMNDHIFVLNTMNRFLAAP